MSQDQSRGGRKHRRNHAQTQKHQRHRYQWTQAQQLKHKYGMNGRTTIHPTSTRMHTPIDTHPHMHSLITHDRMRKERRCHSQSAEVAHPDPRMPPAAPNAGRLPAPTPKLISEHSHTLKHSRPARHTDPATPSSPEARSTATPQHCSGTPALCLGVQATGADGRGHAGARQPAMRPELAN